MRGWRVKELKTPVAFKRVIVSDGMGSYAVAFIDADKKWYVEDRMLKVENFEGKAKIQIKEEKIRFWREKDD